MDQLFQFHIHLGSIHATCYGSQADMGFVIHVVTLETKNNLPKIGKHTDSKNVK
jgi:hypothetical protein